MCMRRNYSSPCWNVFEDPLYTHHVVAVRSRPLSIQSGWHLQTAVLLPVGPARGTQSALHVGRPP